MRPGSGVTRCAVCGNYGAKFFANMKAVMIECPLCHAVITKPNKINMNNEASSKATCDKQEEHQNVKRAK